MPQRHELPGETITVSTKFNEDKRRNPEQRGIRCGGVYCQAWHGETPYFVKGLFLSVVWIQPPYT